jgi:hypothetical protein
VAEPETVALLSWRCVPNAPRRGAGPVEDLRSFGPQRGSGGFANSATDRAGAYVLERYRAASSRPIDEDLDLIVRDIG